MSRSALRLARLLKRDPAAALRMAERLDAQERAKARRVSVKAKPSRERKAAKRKSKTAARAETRAQCVERDSGCAVAYLGGCRGALHHDHFFGRGRFPPDAKKEWMLCEEHDHQKTDNVPDRSTWLRRFRLLAESLDHQEEVALCDRQLALELAQHPQKASALPAPDTAAKETAP